MNANSDTLAVFRDGLVTELAIAAGAIGIPVEDLAAAVGDGQTIADVAAGHGVAPHRVVVALVSDAVADVAADVHRGELTTGHVRWLAALATRRAEEQVTSRFPPIGFRHPAPGRRTERSVRDT